MTQANLTRRVYPLTASPDLTEEEIAVAFAMTSRMAGAIRRNRLPSHLPEGCRFPREMGARLRPRLRRRTRRGPPRR